MGKLAAFVGMTLGGAIGWYAGAVVGFMTAFMLSCVGSGVGLYVARRVAQQYLALALGLTLVVVPRARAQTPEAMKAAGELMQAMHADKVLHDQISTAFDTQVQNNPAMAPYRTTMQQFADKYLTWDEIGPQLTSAYAEIFTEQELHDLVAFYKTPTGQKLALQMGTLAAKGQQIGLRVVQAHQGELADMIRQQQQANAGSAQASAQSPDLFSKQQPADTTRRQSVSTGAPPSP
jgi:uncharacterized protein